VFFVVAVALLFILPAPWNVIGFVASLVVAIVEVAFWNRTVRRRPPRVGAETLLGSRATVIDPGQVRVSGEIWEATSSASLNPGEIVTVVGRDGLTLVVEPVAPNPR
jgi:membrane protein implicated in regulation of membrane protease activity